MLPFSLRQIRAFLAVQEHETVTGAAKAMCRSQTAVTKSIQDLERSIGVPLFDRTPKGMSLTAFGEILLPRAQEALGAFSEARGLVPPLTAKQSSGTQRYFNMDVSDKWIAAFLATADHQNIYSAAVSLNISAAAISSSVRKLEESLGFSLFERAPNVILPTSIGRELVRYVKLALTHLRHAQDELLSLKGLQSGRVAIGSLPLLRTMVVPRAILRLLEEHPYIDVSTTEGHYDALVAALRCGDIDFMVGALRDLKEQEELTEELLFTDQLSVIARKGHPLSQKEGGVQWSDLFQFGWVLPRAGTPTRKLFEEALFRRGLPGPGHVIETSSLVTLRGLLLESDRITVLSHHQIHFDEQYGMLMVLPFDLKEASRPIGITRRVHGKPSPAAELMMSEVRAVVEEIKATF
jgi:LysR family transcriptional regulator, regulator for genes of the gallate degradation pathway